MPRCKSEKAEKRRKKRISLALKKAYASGRLIVPEETIQRCRIMNIGHIPWNKGKSYSMNRPRTQQHKRNLSLSKIGKKQSEEHKINWKKSMLAHYAAMTKEEKRAITAKARAAAAAIEQKKVTA